MGRVERRRAGEQDLARAGWGDMPVEIAECDVGFRCGDESAQQREDRVASGKRGKSGARYFTADSGFTPVASIDYTDGVRITFQNSEVAHFRPSGNADEFRCYAVADSQGRAAEIAQFVVAEPDGVFRRMERDA